MAVSRMATDGSPGRSFKRFCSNERRYDKGCAIYFSQIYAFLTAKHIFWSSGFDPGCC